MSSARKNTSRDGTKKSGEIRVSEDFYARMESDVKSLVKTLHPGHRTAKGDDNEESLFSASKAKSHDSQTKKRKRPESQPAEEREEQSDADEPRVEAKKAKKPAVSESAAKPAVAPAASSSGSAAAPAVSHHYANEKTVYISGLPFSCTEEEIRTFFKDVGTIKSVRLPRWHDSGKLRGYGHVEFTTKAAADSALELSGQYIGDRFVNVDRPMVPRAAQPQAVAAASSESTGPKLHPPGCRTIFIKNLPYDVTEAEIRQHFMVYGPIANIRLAGWNHTQNLKGFGYVEYKREDSTEIAVKKSGTVVIRDRPIVVDYDTAAPKGSYRNPVKDAKKQGQSQHRK